MLALTQVLILSLPPPAPGGARINGVGDTTQYLLVEPAHIRRILWMWAGAVALLPTATNAALGAGTFGFGPAGLLSYQGQRWTVSLLANHLRSVEGTVGRPEVERTFLKPLVSCTFQGGTAVSLESDMTFDWRAPAGDRGIVLLQLGFGRVTLVGPVPLNLNVGARWYPVTPTGGPSWGFRLAISFIVSITREEERRADGERAKRQAPRPDAESD